MDLKDKTILLTGASKGIGLALSKQLDNEGAKLILIGREFGKHPFKEKHTYVEVDLLTDEGISTINATIENKDIDIICNVAGVGIYRKFEDLTVTDLANSLRINTVVPFILTKLAFSKLMQSEIGLVLNIGSGAGTMPFKDRSAYCASKYALRGLTLSLAEEFQGEKPHFCLITLGSTATTFGGKSIEEQQLKMAEGTAIFPIEYVANELVKIIKSDIRETEIVLYPGDRGFGKWEKPK